MLGPGHVRTCVDQTHFLCNFHDFSILQSRRVEFPRSADFLRLRIWTGSVVRTKSFAFPAPATADLASCAMAQDNVAIAAAASAPQVENRGRSLYRVNRLMTGITSEQPCLARD